MNIWISHIESRATGSDVSRQLSFSVLLEKVAKAIVKIISSHFPIPGQTT